MKQTALARKRKPSASPNLSAQAHEQIMDFLQLADKSTHPAIINAAVTLANERQKQHQKSEAKISPTVATLLATIVIGLAAWACWYALVHHPGRTGFSLVMVITTLAIVLICLYALFSGHLSQTNFMSVIRWAGEQINRLTPFRKNRQASFPDDDADAEP
ncbi:hypothetical protein [Granulicella mallensis]|uniref:Transmembrane protein n=1 Tax=Granulicella mallensis TaxID=940614 RepID=A0A7W8E9G0_9BACT|nr:hypothetical protein [Granulicella mallensis]MBB5062330.1 hypothetical protein [Granulicella mallensis]